MENSDPESLPDESETVEYTLIIIKYDLEVGCFTAPTDLSNARTTCITQVKLARAAQLQRAASL